MSKHTAPTFHGPQQHVSVWAPNAQRIVHIVTAGVRSPMTPGTDGWWTSPEPLSAGSEYAFSLDGGELRPDPRSLLQPHGVHGPCEVVDLAAYDWHDADWSGRSLQGAVFYELHIGTFTGEGTFAAAEDRLDHLVALGVTHVEVLPVNGVPGQWNWGYDGVNLYATTAAYGGPKAFQHFVDTCHAKGLAVCLDVVYNHLGPSGNYLPEFGPYFNGAHHTPWGAAVNLDGAGSDNVRSFFIENALMWLEDFHVDAFRMDAVHALVDESAVHFLEEFTATIDDAAKRLGRDVVVVAESDRNDPGTVTPRRSSPVADGELVAAGGRAGLGLSGQWADDVHHALHVLLTGETQGYYKDFADPEALEKVFNTPFFHDGTYSTFRGRAHGRQVDPAQTPGWQYVASLQTHDQVGNRATGERLSQLVSSGRLAAGAALLLCSPYTPMLFMGEEWGASTPWQFFTDHEDPDIAAATSKGRAEEFAAHGWGASVPDPQDPATRENSVLNWHELDDPDGPQAVLLEWYRTLLALRRDVPQLADPRLNATRVERRGMGSDSVVVVHRGDYRVVANLSNNTVTEHGSVIASWHTVRDSESGVILPPDSVAILR